MIAAIPKRLEEMDEDLVQLEKMLVAERAKLDESRSFKARQEQQLQDEEEQIRNSKNRLGAIKNAREMALLPYTQTRS